MTEAPENSSPTSVTCNAAKDPAVRVFIMAAMLLGIGAWCWMDAASGKYPPPEAWDMENINAAAGYAFNHYTPWIAIPAGLLLALRGVLALRRVLTADEDGIGYAGKEKRPWEKITALDASQLKGKGILTVEFGSDVKLVLDSWKLQNFRELVAFVEAHSAAAPNTGA